MKEQASSYMSWAVVSMYKNDGLPGERAEFLFYSLVDAIQQHLPKMQLYIQHSTPLHHRMVECAPNVTNFPPCFKKKKIKLKWSVFPKILTALYISSLESIMSWLVYTCMQHSKDNGGISSFSMKMYMCLKTSHF